MTDVESFLKKHREFGEEFCALHSIESIEELQEKKDEFFRYIAERVQEEDLFGVDATECSECGEPLDLVEMESMQRICFACAFLREE